MVHKMQMRDFQKFSIFWFEFLHLLARVISALSMCIFASSIDTFSVVLYVPKELGSIKSSTRADC